ncbi:hypothetical protein [Leisingera sp.]|uniref:hypothetical protein n=1 Tax=Leisingera sp. TaxID=1879318 RepID=UPI002B27404E|nr:hypothetical protein [Leisingera sp.]
MSRAAYGALLAALAALPANAMSAGIDVDGDGKASLTELQAVYSGVTGELFAEIDTNGDGFLDDEEMADAVSAGVLEDPVIDL